MSNFNCGIETFFVEEFMCFQPHVQSNADIYTRLESFDHFVIICSITKALRGHTVTAVETSISSSFHFHRWYCNA